MLDPTLAALFRSIAIGVLSLAALGGCGKDDSGRVAVWGAVTWQGKPVPAGVVYFSPDAKKGNKGPQGFALIRDGHYDSRDAKSKGCVTGPLVAIVQGCTGEGRSGTFPYGRPLFASHELSLEVPAGGGQVDLTVPDTAKPYIADPGSEVD
jgi:hypothetical protein